MRTVHPFACSNLQFLTLCTDSSELTYESSGPICKSCQRRQVIEAAPTRCRLCLDDAQARAGLVTTLVEPFLSLALQRAVHKLGSLPVKGATGTVAPVDYKIFAAIHHMLVSRLPVPKAGQGISMNRLGGPVQKTGMGGGPLSFGFDVYMTEAVASVTNESSWCQRAHAASSKSYQRLHCGPVFHHKDGCIGCIAAPLEFTYKVRGKYAGLNAGTMTVKHDYFVLDVGGEFRGMAASKNRDSDGSILNRVMLCQYANRLRARGAHFSPAQVSTIDLHLQAVLRSIPMAEEDSDGEELLGVEQEGEEDEEEAEDESRVADVGQGSSSQ